MFQIRVLCYSTVDSECPIFERILNVSSLYDFHFEIVLDSLFCLFGKSCKVLIEVVQ